VQPPRIEDEPSPIGVSCPTCDGPLHAVPDGVECERGHVFEADVAAQGHDLISVRALWHAVKALRDRAAMSRWQAENPHLTVSRAQDPESLRRSAAEDDELAEVLRDQAQQLDRIVARGRRSG
jgi:hypothetical protein